MAKPDVNPLESLKIIQTTLTNVRRHLFYSSGPVYRMWAIAWFVGFITTFLAESGSFGGALSDGAVAVVWAGAMSAAGLYTFVFYRRHPVDADYRRRFALMWVVGFTLAFLTVWSRTAVGLTLDAVEFAIAAVHTLSVIYLVTGAVLLDRLQAAVGVWLGGCNVVALRFGFPDYTLAMGLLLGIGLMIAGFIEDCRRKRPAAEVDD